MALTALLRPPPQVKGEQEERIKRREGQARRAARMQKRAGPGAAAGSDVGGEEKLFVAGLLDLCPRCGVEVSADTAEAAAAHLHGCADQAAIAKHGAAKAAAAARSGAAAKGQAAQEDAMAVAQWELNGRQVGQ